MFIDNHAGGAAAARLNYDLDHLPSTTDRVLPRHRPPVPANDNEQGRYPRLVGLQGYGGAGKSEVARALTGHGYTAMHIKAPLRAMVAELLRQAGLDEAMIDRYLDGDLKRETIPQFRRSGTELQQFIGGQFGRDFCYRELWLDMWIERASGVLEAGGRVTQESVRYINEADAIRTMGGVIIQVNRPGVGPLNGHQSERLPVSNPDMILHNSGSITDLRLQVASWLSRAA